MSMKSVEHKVGAQSLSYDFHNNPVKVKGTYCAHCEDEKIEAKTPRRGRSRRTCSHSLLQENRNHN